MVDLLDSTDFGSVAFLVWLMARTLNGTILFNEHKQGDYVELFIRNGFVHFEFNLGDGSSSKGTVSIRSAKPLAVGEWYRIAASQRGKEGTLQINEE